MKIMIISCSLNRNFACVVGKTVQREPGERWMIHGPVQYVPSEYVTIVDRRYAV